MSALLADPSSAESWNSSGQVHRVDDMIGVFTQALDKTVGRIDEVNEATKILALNAMIEAARAGDQGAAFHVIAREMKDLATKTSDIAGDVATKTKADVEQIGLQLRGARLCDLARMNVDLIDRNLYERTCDVRWWATDSSVVEALTRQEPNAFDYASQRMGVILGAYTVYLDLVLCDPDGRIVANGRPEKYASRGASVGGEAWFQAAMATLSGEGFGFQSAHRSSLVEHAPALIYSAAVREGGRIDGQIVGALGVIFDWSGLAQPILSGTPIEDADRPRTELYIVDAQQNILAGCPVQRDGESVELDPSILPGTASKGFFRTKFRDKDSLVAVAAAPGFETYTTGWYALIVHSLA
jgi:hypothetical protein